MHLGGDFFKIADFVVALIRLIAQFFGDDDEQPKDDKPKT